MTHIAWHIAAKRCHYSWQVNCSRLLTYSYQWWHVHTNVYLELHPTDTHTTKYYKTPKGDQLAINEGQKLYILLTKKWKRAAKNPKGRPIGPEWLHPLTQSLPQLIMFLRARMTSPSDGSPNRVVAAMFLRARMTSLSDGSPNRVVAAMFLRARMTSPSDGGPNTYSLCRPFLLRVYTRTLSASQYGTYPLLLSRNPSQSSWKE